MKPRIYIGLRTGNLWRVSSDNPNDYALRMRLELGEVMWSASTLINNRDLKEVRGHLAPAYSPAINFRPIYAHMATDKVGIRYRAGANGRMDVWVPAEHHAIHLIPGAWNKGIGGRNEDLNRPGTSYYLAPGPLP